MDFRIILSWAVISFKVGPFILIISSLDWAHMSVWTQGPMGRFKENNAQMAHWIS